jgi:hypothetical protein
VAIHSEQLEALATAGQQRLLKQLQGQKCESDYCLTEQQLQVLQGL